jgi:PAS domain S-box-containing protein
MTVEQPYSVASEAAVIAVLIVEDNPIDRHLFRSLLQENGVPRFQAFECARGRAALDEVRRIRPDCVLLDLNLPDMDGLHVLQSIVREPDACPVVVMTAYGTEQVAVDAMKAGAADYLVKGTVSHEQLSHVIENAIEKRSLQRKIEEQRLALEERNRQLESALARYRVLTEAMPQLVWTANHPGGGWDYVNERWSQLTGTPAADAFGDAWLEFIDPQDRERTRSLWQSALAVGEPLELECRLHSSAGTRRWQLMRAVPVLKDGAPIKWIGTLTDVDDQRRTEELLHQRQKLDSIGVLAGGVAHDFNNLLVGIVGGVSYALEVLPSGHDLCSILEGALRAGERAAELTRQLLAYAGKGRVQPGDVDLEETLRATWDLLQATIPRSVELKIAVPPDLPPVYTDPSQLQQVLMNLILNAAEAIPPEKHGIVIVSASVENVPAARTSWSGDLSAGRYVVFEVRDNGAGIPPEWLHKIFDPFFTSKFTGRGLGLAAVHGIVRTNRGSIDVESAPGQGAAFRVYLPAGSAAPKLADAAARTSPSASPSDPILVVDDESVVRNMARAALERAGYVVHTVSSGSAALQSIRDSPGPYSLVLLDFNMPGMNGEQTLDAIREIRPDLPVLISSGYSDFEIRARFAGRVVAGFLQKPFRADALSRTVSGVLAGLKAAI